MDLQTLKLFSLGAKSSIIHGACGFSQNAIWVVDGNNKITKIGNLTTRDLAKWWYDYINDNISNVKDLKNLINEGLVAIKKTEFGNSELGVSLVIAREINNELEVLLIGDCEAIIGSNDKVKTVINVKKNRQITNNLIYEMINASKLMQCPIVQSRQVIAKDLQTKVRGESSNSYNLLRGKDTHISTYNSIYQKFNKNEITHITLINGGVRQYYTVFDIGCISEIYNYSKSNDYIKLYEKISHLEKEDLECNIYPRIKPIRSYMLISVSV